MIFQVARPAQLSEVPGRLESVRALIMHGGAVDPHGLGERILGARWFVAAHMETTGELVGCIALKSALPEYTERIAELAGCDIPEHSLEVGWCVVSTEHRGRGLSSVLLEKLLHVVPPGAPLHATAHLEGRMARTLVRHGFVRQGRTWRSSFCSDAAFTIDLGIFMRPVSREVGYGEL